MTSKMKIDRASGALILAFVGALAVALWAVTSVYSSENALAQTLQDIAVGKTLFYIGMAFTMVAGVLSVAVAGVCYRSFRGYGETLSLVGALGFAAFGVTMVAGGVAGMVLGNLAQSFVLAAGLGDAQSAAAVATGAAPVGLLLKYALLASVTTFLPLGVFSMGVLIASSRALPRALGWLAMASAVAMPMAWLSMAAGMSAVGSVLAWMMLVGGWMVVRGTRLETAMGLVTVSHSAGRIAATASVN